MMVMPHWSSTLAQSFQHSARFPFHLFRCGRPCRLISDEDKAYFKNMLFSLMSNNGLNDAGSFEDLFINRYWCHPSGL